MGLCTLSRRQRFKDRKLRETRIPELHFWAITWGKKKEKRRVSSPSDRKRTEGIKKRCTGEGKKTPSFKFKELEEGEGTESIAEVPALCQAGSLIVTALGVGALESEKGGELRRKKQL